MEASGRHDCATAASRAQYSFTHVLTLLALVWQVVVATNCRSAGDALRALDQQALIEDDFVLVSGDVVANLDLAAVVQEHQARKAKDNHAIMTMVGQSGCGHARHSSLSGRMGCQACCTWKGEPKG